MSIIFQILNALLCGAMAAIDADKIERGKSVNHFLNGCIHITFASTALFLFDWKIALAILFQSRVVFDVVLNLFRELPIGYVSPKPTSVVDKFEKKLNEKIEIRRANKLKRLANL